jgi:hypothetical protein
VRPLNAPSSTARSVALLPKLSAPAPPFAPPVPIRSVVLLLRVYISVFMLECPLSCHFSLSNSFTRHSYLMATLFTFPNTRWLGTCQLHVDARADRRFFGEWWRQTASREYGSGSSHLDVALRTQVAGCTMRLPYGTLLAQTIGGSSSSAPQKGEMKCVPSLPEGRSSLTYPWDWPAFHWVDKLFIFPSRYPPFLPCDRPRTKRTSPESI